MSALYYRKFKRTLLMTIFLMSSDILAQKEIDMFVGGQEEGKEFWCWASAAEAVLFYHDVSVTQQELADWAVGGRDEGVSFSGTPNSLDKVLWEFGEIGTIFTKPNSDGYGNLSKEDIIEQINFSHPILALIAFFGEEYGHAYIITGYTGSGIGDDIGDVVCYDAGDGTIRDVSYAELVQFAMTYKWEATLRTTKDPPTLTTTGPPSNLDFVRVVSGTTQLYDSPQNLSYYAQKFGDSPTLWEWELVFPHQYGEAVVC